MTLELTSFESELEDAFTRVLRSARGGLPHVGAVEAAWTTGVSQHLRPVVTAAFPTLLDQAADAVGLSAAGIPAATQVTFVDRHLAGVVRYAELLHGVVYRYPNDPEALAARLTDDRARLLAGPLAIHLWNAATFLAVRSGRR